MTRTSSGIIDSMAHSYCDASHWHEYPYPIHEFMTYLYQQVCRSRIVLSIRNTYLLIITQMLPILLKARGANTR